MPLALVRHRPALGSARRVRRNGEVLDVGVLLVRSDGLSSHPVECALELAGDLLLDARQALAEIVETSFDCLLPGVEEGSGGAGGDGGSGVATPSESLFFCSISTPSMASSKTRSGSSIPSGGAPRVEDRHTSGNADPSSARGLREKDLPTLSGRADPGRSDDVQTEIPLLGDVRLARVQAHPNEDGGIVRPVVYGVRTLHRDGGGDGLARPREGEEERIALRVDLDPVRTEHLSDDAPVLRSVSA